MPAHTGETVAAVETQERQKPHIIKRVGATAVGLVIMATPFLLGRDTHSEKRAIRISAPTPSVAADPIENPSYQAGQAEATARGIVGYLVAVDQAAKEKAAADYLAAVAAGEQAKAAEETAAQAAVQRQTSSAPSSYTGPSVATSGPTCAGTGVESIIRNAFAGTGEEDHFLYVAYRESNCIPTAINNGESCSPDGLMHARGLLQLCGHDDLLSQACPGQDPEVAALDPYCNAQASRRLYDEAGLGPWGG